MVGITNSASARMPVGQRVVIDEMKARIRALGVKRVATSYWTFNEPSAALMARAGFVPCKIEAETGL